MMPAVRRPYSAGSAPVINFKEEISHGLNVWLKTLMPSGRMMPFNRYCRSLWSARTWICPKESWTTSGACSRT